MYATSSENDGAFFVYLEDVDESGKVTYITEGQLRPLHRKVSRERPPYTIFGINHSFNEKDGQSLEPGKTTKLTCDLLPTSVLIKQGHQIRVAIAGHDKDSFVRYPAEGTPEITILRNAVSA
nr:CocE/NonD family hydrolase C-terminal non-catalytic domain-containing protein [Scytonema sp. UIC 10036]